MVGNYQVKEFLYLEWFKGEQIPSAMEGIEQMEDSDDEMVVDDESDMSDSDDDGDENE